MKQINTRPANSSKSPACWCPTYSKLHSALQSHIKTHVVAVVLEILRQFSLSLQNISNIIVFRPVDPISGRRAACVSVTGTANPSFINAHERAQKKKMFLLWIYLHSKDSQLLCGKLFHLLCQNLCFVQDRKLLGPAISTQKNQADQNEAPRKSQHAPVKPYVFIPKRRA